MTDWTGLPLGGYLRISDVDVAELRRAVREGRLTEEQAAEEEKKAILKQKEDLSFLAGKHGRPVVWYEDHRLSAFKRNVRRVDFWRLHADIKAQRLAGALAYDIDRFTRQPVELEAYIHLYEDIATKNGFRCIFDTLSGQNYDLTTSDGQFSARLFVGIANKSSQDTSRRIKRDNIYKAKKGKYHGGQPIFGWDLEDRTKLDPKAAKIRKKAIKDHLAGDGIAQITTWLHEQGVTNPATGKPFTWAGTKEMIYAARNAGIRIHLGEPIFDEDGKYVMGDWEPIVSVEIYEALAAVRKAKKGKPQQKTAAKYLLTNIARCGRCGNRMNGKPVWVRGKKTPTYAYNCSKTTPDACGKMGVSGPRVDELIKQLVWAQVEKSLNARSIETKPEPWEGEEDLARVEKDIAEIKALWEEKKVSAGNYLVTLDALEVEKKELLGKRAFHNVAPQVKLITPELIRGGWDGISLDRQRKILRTVLTGVIIHPSPHGRGGGFNPSRVEPVFA
ncbi:recombinase family protein [Streptomyces sp. NPDC002644]